MKMQVSISSCDDKTLLSVVDQKGIRTYDITGEDIESFVNNTISGKKMVYRRLTSLPTEEESNG